MSDGSFVKKSAVQMALNQDSAFFFSFKFIDIFQSILKSKIEGGVNKWRVRKRLKVNKSEGVGLQ